MPDTPNGKRDWIPIICLALAVLVVVILYFQGGNPMDHLKIVAGYTILILVFFYGLMVLIAMVNGRIDLRYLVSEPGPDGHASMARFQLLIFTIVIALSLFLIIVAAKTPSFPKIPPEILTLLGISATTYAVGKGLQGVTKPDETPPASGTTKQSQGAQQQSQAPNQG